MSLQIWLPLIKDLKNQGLNNNIIITNNGSTFNSVGKLGGCYNFDNSMGILTNNSITLNTTFSISCWIKINSWNRDWANVFKIYKDVYDYIGLCMNQTSSTIKQLGFHIYKNNGSNARKAVYDEYYMPLTLGEWYHLCFTVTPTEIKTYQNGDCIKTATIDSNFPSVSNYILSLGKNPLFRGLDCSINDFRIYDEALSPMQIKLISQGLVAHYLLNNNGSGNNNLIPNQGEYTVNNPFVWSSNKADGAKWVPNSAFEIKSSTTYTLSLCCDGNLQTKHIATRKPSPEEKAFTVWLYLSNDGTTKSWQTGQYDIPINLNSSNFSYKQIGQKHIWTFTTSSTQRYISIRVNNYSNDIDTLTLNYWNFKVEEGDKSTSWCPNSTDSIYTQLGYDNNIEYDVSGYCNNGTKYNITDYTSDTPRYSVATKFNGTNSYINVGRGGMVRDEITVNIWGYMDDWTKYNGRLISCTEGGGWNFEPASGGKIHFSLGTGNTSNTYKNPTGYTLSELSSGWHMFTGTYDGFTVKQYVDGVLNTSVNAYTTKTMAFYNANNSIIIGAEASGGAGGIAGSYFNGLISDFRIYATTLSQQDIKRLYLVRASIDRNANFYVGEIQEEQKKSISKNSVSSFNKYIQFNSINPNIIPNSVKMALGSANASTGTWRTAGTSNMTRTRLEILNSPIGKCYGFQNEGIQTANDGSCYGIDSFPLAANTQYTISMWARIIDGTEGYVGYNIYQLSSQDGGTHNGTIIKNYRVTKLPSNGDWMRCWYTFTTNSNTTRNIYIGVCTGEQSVTTQMCAIKIEKGNISTPWIPKEEDQNYNEYTKNIVSINKQQGIYADSFIEI